MRALFSFILVLLINVPLMAKSYKYTIAEHPYRFTTYYEMHGEESYEGKVIKDSIAVRTIYDLYDAQSNFIGQGICRLLSLGSLCAWARMVDLYDGHGKQIGLIEGRTLTTSKASYNFYDAEGKVVAISYLNHDCSAFIIEDVTKKRIAFMERQFVKGAIDPWKITIYDDSSCDIRFLKIFSAFAVDHQKYFKADA